MSNPNKPLINEDGIRMMPEDEFKVYLLYKEGRTNQEIIEQTSRPDGKKWSYPKIQRLVKKMKDGYIPKVDADKAEKAIDAIMGIGLAGELKDFDAEKSMSRSFKMATRMLEQALKDAEEGYEIEDEMRRKVPIKTIMDCIEKAGKYWTSYQKTKKDSGPAGQVQIDYKEMAKLYMGAKKDGIEYDSKGHMKAVLEEVTKQNQSSDEEIPAE